MNLHNIIPGGSHTYSKGDDQFPTTAPKHIRRAKGYTVWDLDNHQFVDWTMGLASVSIGHANEEIIEAVTQWLGRGSNFPRPSEIEEALANEILELSHAPAMVKLGKHGSDATSSAVRLARAFTGRDRVVACSSNPFYSVHDWWIGTTKASAGVPNAVSSLTHTFPFGDLVALDAILDRWGKEIACIIIEPAATTPHGSQGNCLRCGGQELECKNEVFWKSVAKKAREVGALFILDENKTGFRMALPGAQSFYGLDADMICYGKAIANGFSVSALVGRPEILDQGGIYQQEHDRVFLMSATHGGETHALAAALKTIELMRLHNVPEHMWQIGIELSKAFNNVAHEVGVGGIFVLSGYGCFPTLSIYAGDEDAIILRTLFLQEMARNRIIFNFIAPSLAHDKKAIELTISAAKKALAVCAEAIALGDGIARLEGPLLRPVFRRRN